MSEKERAEYLLNRFKTNIHNMSTNELIPIIMITLDSIIELECLTDEAWLSVPDEYKVQYWKGVKRELELLKT
jgi:hypothetical protein